MGRKIGVVMLVVAIAFGSIVVWESFNPRPSLAATVEVPPGFVKGTVFYAHLPSGVLLEYEVEDIRGSWVLGKAVSGNTWNTGTPVWVNFGAMPEVAVKSQPAK